MLGHFKLSYTHMFLDCYGIHLCVELTVEASLHLGYSLINYNTHVVIFIQELCE